MSGYAFVAAEAAQQPVARSWRVRGVARSGFYARRARSGAIPQTRQAA